MSCTENSSYHECACADGIRRLYSSGLKPHSCFLLNTGGESLFVNELENGVCWFCSCNPPAVPYLGMYLTDLAFIEEGTPNFTEEGLVNFSKMRMVGGNFIISLFQWLQWLREKRLSHRAHCFFILGWKVGEHWVSYPMWLIEAIFSGGISACMQSGQRGGEWSSRDDFLRQSSDRQMLKASCWTARFWAPS